MYKYIKSFKTRQHEKYKELRKQRLMKWRREPNIVRIRRPTKLDSARRLGYKAKQGYILARVRLRRGSRRKQKPDLGRRSKRTGLVRVTAKRSRQAMAESRANRNFTNLEVLNSYKAEKDGKFVWFEVILVDPHHPVIKSDPKINWITNKNQQGRTFRGKTSIGRKHRGLHHKGFGAERMRRVKHKDRR